MKKVKSKRSVITPQVTTSILGVGLAVVMLWIGVRPIIYRANLDQIGASTARLPKYGISTGSDLLNQPADQQEARLAAIEALGAGWIRIDFDWSQIQPESAANFEWDRTDTLIKRAADHNLKVLGIIDFTPAWARPTYCNDRKQCAPAEPAAFGTFAGALAERYQAAGLHYWEIWNEPNTQNFFAPSPNVGQYAALLRAAHTRIHAVDNKAIVLTGGTAPADNANDGSTISPSTFLEKLYANRAQSYFDAVAAHPYTYPVSPTFHAPHAWNKLTAGPGNLRGIMTAHHDTAKRIWLTEFGAPTGGPGPGATGSTVGLIEKADHVDESLQASIFRDAIKLYEGFEWAGPIFFYADRDAGTDPSTNESFFGLRRADNSPKPAYEAVQALIAKP